MVVKGKTYVWGTLRGDCGEQIVICGDGGEAYEGHSSVQHRKKWRCMVWSEVLRREWSGKCYFLCV